MTADSVASYLTALRQAERLAEALRRNDAEHPDDDGHQAPGRFVREHAAEYGIRTDLLDAIDPGDCGWVIPLRVGGVYAVCAYDPSGGWYAYAGENIPAWIAEQLP